MKYRRLLCTLVLLTAAIACAPANESASSDGEEPCTLASAASETIRAMEASHEAEVLAADWEAMSASLAPDIVVMPANQPEIIGREALIAWQRRFPPITEFDLVFEEVDGCGGFAYVKGHYSMAMQAAESAELVADSGRWIWILRKSAEGRWLVTHDISNSEKALPSGN